MTEIIHEYSHRVIDVDGTPYVARVQADQAPGGLWEGRIEFTDPTGRIRYSTGRETTQSRREFIVYWAEGLEPVYLEGAFVRARSLVTR